MLGETSHCLGPDTGHIEAHVLLGFGRLDQDPSPCPAELAGPLQHLGRALNGLYGDHLFFFNHHRLANIEFAQFLGNVPSSLDVGKGLGAGPAAGQHPGRGKMLLTVLRRVDHDDASCRQFIREGAHYDVCVPAFTTDTPAENTQSPPVRQVSQQSPAHMDPRLHDAAHDDGVGDPMSTQHSHPAAHAGRSDHAKHIYHVPECGIGIARQSDTDDSTTGPFRPFRDQKRQTSACGNQSQGLTIFHGRFLPMYPGSFKGKWPGRSFLTTLT